MKTRDRGPAVRMLFRPLAPLRHLYDWHAGWLLGNRFVRVTHIGRRTGRRYQTMLEVVGTGPADGEVIVIAGLGRSAQWFRNVQAHGAPEVAIGRHRFRPTCRVLDVEEADRVVAAYERRHRWLAPVLRRAVSWLVGWRYDGSAPARLRLVHQLPLVGLRPDGP